MSFHFESYLGIIDYIQLNTIYFSSACSSGSITLVWT